MCTCCRFERSEALLTSRFTQSYLAQHTLPRDLTSYLFIDIITTGKTRRPPCGMLLLLNCFLYAAKAKYRGICFVAVTRKGRTLGNRFGCKEHMYREDGATRYLMCMGLDYISMVHINKKLRIGNANDHLLSSLCSRHGLQARTRDRLITRCA